MGGLKRLWVQGLQGLEVPQRFYERNGSKDLGFMLWTVMEHLSIWELLRKTLFRRYRHKQKIFSPSLLVTMCFVNMTSAASSSLYSGRTTLPKRLGTYILYQSSGNTGK